MKRTSRLLFASLLVLASASFSWSYFKPTTGGQALTAAAQAFVETLDEKQKAQAVLEYDTPKRLDWHFIPKPERKGLQLKEMTAEQQKAAHGLLKASISALGYDKATHIMELEVLLHALEKGAGPNIRDPLRYYFILFGQPAIEGKWGLSIEGHHLSLNFVIDQGALSSTTPQFMATNPAEVLDEYGGPVKKGTRILAKEETLAFELVNSLSPEQKSLVILADKAPKEIRAAGEAQPPQTAATGIPASKLTPEQLKLLKDLVKEYASTAKDEVLIGRLNAIEKAGWGEVYFAWEGATKPHIGHYYRVQGPTFVIELVNTQPDAAGNPANHIHCVWRDMAGDFGLTAKGQ